MDLSFPALAFSGFSVKNFPPQVHIKLDLAGGVGGFNKSLRCISDGVVSL